MTVPASAPDPYRSATLRPTRATGAALLLARTGLAAWATVVGVLASSAADRPQLFDARARQFVTWSGIALALAWSVAAAAWSVRRTVNVHLLDGRYPTRSRAGRVWAYPVAWVAFATLAVASVPPNDELDVRPVVMVTGLLITMGAGYRVLLRNFRSIVRVQPVAHVVTLFLVDVAVAGLWWWRIVSWPDDARLDPAATDLTAAIAFGAAAVLVGGLWLTWYLDRQADVAEATRALALRTRHDHKLVRRQGLDPMDPATRWALLLARREQALAGVPVELQAAADDVADALARGAGPELAVRLERVAARYDPAAHARSSMPMPPDADATSTGTARPSRPLARFWVPELLRYVTVAAQLCVVAGCASLIDAPSIGDRGLAMSQEIVLWGMRSAPIAGLGWVLASAVHAARRGGPSRWRLPAVLLVVAAAAVVGAAFAGGNRASVDVAAVVVGVSALLLALRVALELGRFFGAQRSSLTGWMIMLPVTVLIWVAGPLDASGIVGGSRADVAFSAIVAGLAGLATAVFAAVAMSELEGALRGATRFRRPPTSESTQG